MNYAALLAAEVAADRPAAVAKVVSAPVGLPVGTGDAILVSPAGLLWSGLADVELQNAMAEVAMRCLAEGRTGIQSLQSPLGALRVYVESHLPSPVLVVVGAGHVGQMVAQFGAQTGFDVWVLDDRSAYANAERFPQASLIRCGPFASELAALNLGPRHYVVLMTRGHHHDREALRQLVDVPVAYLGMIGSRTRVETIFELLAAEGVAPENLQRVRAPIGLDIGARTPAEIAVSVLGEIIAARRGGTGAPLSQLGRALVHTNRR